MSSYLLDTNHASAVYRKQIVLVRHPKRDAADIFAVSLPSVGELWYMVFNSVRVSDNTRAMSEMLAELGLWPFDSSAAEEFGRIKAELRRLGRMIPDVDIQIAAIARVNNLALLTDDAHFASVTGLKTDNWIR
jgi:tRNA(fMet)-specific endonuclease VapC